MNKRLATAVFAASACGATAQTPPADGAAEALARAVFAFCAPLAEDKSLTSPQKIADAGIVLLPDPMPAPPSIFRGEKAVRGFFALRGAAPGAPSVDGLISPSGSRCAIRLLNAPSGHRRLVEQLDRPGSGWRRAPSPPGGELRSDMFLRQVPSKPYDVIANVSYRADGQANPDGMTAFVTVGRSTKGGR